MNQGGSSSALGSGSSLPVRVSSEMPVDKIIQVLTQHGCSDVTGQLDLDQCGKAPISGGGFADIYRGAMYSGEPIAIKCPRLYLQRDRGGRKILKHVARELYTWSRLKHPNVLELLGLVQFQHHVAMVAPWMSNRTLLEYVNRNPNVNRHQLGLGISEGIAYLHQSDAIHGDIKGANILISGEGVPKLTDFGCSLLKRGAICFTTTTGGASHSTRWAAPEILAGETEQSKEADVYALGMTLLELVTGLVPFSGIRADMAVITAVVFNKRTPERPKVLISFGHYGADLLWEIMTDSWSYHPSNRPDSLTVRDRIRGVPSESDFNPASPLVVDRDSDSDSGSDSDSQQNPPQQSHTSVDIIQKLDSMPIRELEIRLAQWRENLPVTESRVHELIAALARPGAIPELRPLLARARQDYEQNKFLCQKSQEILARKHGHLQQLQQTQNSARMTPTNIGEPNRSGNHTTGGLPIQGSGIPGWQGQPEPSSIPQFFSQSFPRNSNDISSQLTPPSQSNANHQMQQTPPQFRPGAVRLSALPRDHATFGICMNIWLMQTGRSLESIPKIGHRPLDLYQMFIELEGLGGPEKVQATGLWHIAAVKMGYVAHDQSDPQMAHIARTLADAYFALLVPFNQFIIERPSMSSFIMNGQQKQPVRASNQDIDTGANQGGGDQTLRQIMPGENLQNMPNLQRVLTYINLELKDWMPELPTRAKLIRVSQMDISDMQQQGWTDDRVQLLAKFKPRLNDWRASLMRQQQMQAQQLGQGGGQATNQQSQQRPLQLQSQHPNDPRSSSDGGSLPPTMQPASVQGISGPPKLPFPTEVAQRARLVVESLSREIEQSRAGQYQLREVPEIQRTQMNQAIVGANSLAVEFERIASLHYMLFNDQPQTRQYLDQAMLSREQYRILWSGQQHYIMSLEEVVMAENSLRLAIHTLKTAYAHKVKQHQEQAAAAGYHGDGQLSQKQIHQQHALTMQMNNNGGPAHPPALVQQRSSSQPQYGLPKAGPSKSQIGIGQSSKPGPSTAMPRKRAVSSRLVNTLSPANSYTSSSIGSTPTSSNEPAVPKPPQGGKAKVQAKRTPSQSQKPKKGLKLAMPPPLSFDQPHSNKRQRENKAPSPESVVPFAEPSSLKRMKTALDYRNDDPKADSSAKIEEIIDGDDALGGADVLEADTLDLNTNKETPDSAADEIGRLSQRSPGKGEAPAGDGKSLAGGRAPTLTEDFWEAFNREEMSEGAYFMGGGANGFNWSGPIEPNANSWIGITGTAA